MALSIFDHKEIEPTIDDVKSVVGMLANSWQEIIDYTFKKYPNAIEQWNFSGKKYGWSFRLKDRKRAILYLIPRDNYFLVAFVFGKNATEQAMVSNVSSSIKEIINSAKVYAEGRGFRFEFKEESLLNDVKTLIDIKLKN